MSENKRKRLSLKSKKSSVSSENEEEANIAKRSKVQNDQPSNSDVNLKCNLEMIQEQGESDDIICLSDEELTAVNHGNQSNLLSKTSRPRTEDGSRNNTSLLDVSDEQLRVLRMALLEHRHQQSLVTYVELPPNPLYEDNVKRSGAMSVREATPDTFSSHAEQEYSPLPQMCKACAGRKPLYHDFSSIIKTVLREHQEDNISKNSSDRKAFQNTTLLKSISPGTSLDTAKNMTIPKSDDNFVVNRTELDEVTQKVSDLKTQNKNVETLNLKNRRNPIPEIEQERPSTSMSVSPSQDPKDSVISACPLCTVEFEKGTSQMDMDSHIAACLSAAGDDVMW